MPGKVSLGLMDLLLELLFTAALGAVELTFGVLGGVALGLPFFLIGAATILGNLVALALTLLAGERLQRWIYRRPGFAKQRVERVWNRYGVLGIVFLAPLITGAVLGTVLALALGAPSRSLLRWMAVSTALRGELPSPEPRPWDCGPFSARICLGTFCGPVASCSPSSSLPLFHDKTAPSEARSRKQHPRFRFPQATP